MTGMTLPETITLPIDDVIPYPNNPRTIPEQAIEAVAESIQRFGYQQPIVVDPNNVVIVGHTRLAAIKSLGWTEVPVYVADLPEDKAREYRLVDNRTSEMGQWDHDALVVELREFEQGLLDRYFPDVDLEVAAVHDAAVTQADVDKAAAKVATIKEKADLLTTEVVCPSCYHTFDVSTASLPGLSRTDLAALADGRS